MGPLSPSHDTSSCCRWRRQYPEIQGSCKQAILNKQSRKVDMGRSFSLWVGWGLTTPYCKKPACYDILQGLAASLMNSMVNLQVL
jgi:hypothetical protein